MANLKRFTKPDVDRIEISDGDWIEVRRDLNNGEVKKLEAAGQKPPIAIDGKLYNNIDWERYNIERAMIFMTAWSLRGEDDKPVRLDISALKALEPESFAEIDTAIVNHTIERALAKKALREAEAKAKEAQLTPQTSNASETTTKEGEASAELT